MDVCPKLQLLVQLIFHDPSKQRLSQFVSQNTITSGAVCVVVSTPVRTEYVEGKVFKVQPSALKPAFDASARRAARD